MIPPCNSTKPRIPYRALQHLARLLVILVLLAGGTEALAQAPAPDDTAMRNQAFLLCKQNNFVDALPLLEKLAAAHPTDFVIQERLGSALVGTSQNSPDPAVRKQVILRARSVFQHAKELGDTSDYLATMLEKLPENGEENP